MTPQEWRDHQSRLRVYVFDTMTRYSLRATSETEARAWFDDAMADLEMVDCDACQFAQPRLVAVLPTQAAVPLLPRSGLQRFAERLSAATRPVLRPFGAVAVS